jgi:hypothetical protein
MCVTVMSPTLGSGRPDRTAPTCCSLYRNAEQTCFAKQAKNAARFKGLSTANAWSV